MNRSCRGRRPSLRLRLSAYRKMVGERSETSIRKRAKRAIIASQRTRPFGCAQGRLLRAVRPDPPLRKERLLGMTNARGARRSKHGPNYGLDTVNTTRHANGLTGGLMTEAEENKRATRRFALRLPVSVSYTEDGVREKNAQTRDVSARGICFFVDSAITAGSAIEFTLTLPPEITLTESIRVRCKGKVVRVEAGDSEGRVAVAAVIDEYEFLSEP